MAFTKTIGNRDPWCMPSDGTDLISITPKTKKWERKQYHRASRREAKTIIRKEICNEN